MSSKKSSDKTVTVLLKNLKKRVVNNTIGIAPDWLLQSIIMGNVDLSKDCIPGLIFTIAESREDLEAAYGLLYKAYLAAGYMKENTSKLRVTPYHALPTTSTLIGKIEDQVICTVSIVKSNEYGVPIESVINLDQIKKDAMDEIGEVSALAVHPDYRGSANNILFHMFKYLYEYSKFYMHLDYFVIGVHPTWFPFYKSVFGFVPLNAESIDKYDFVEGAPVQAGYLDLNKVKYYFAKHHLDKDKTSNLFTFFCEKKFDNYHFPERKISKSFDSVMSPPLFKYFFIEKTNGIEEFDGKQLLILSNIYRSKEFQEILEPYLKDFGITCSLLHRLHYRTKVKFKARIYLEDDNHIDCEVVDASQGGIGIYSKSKLELNKTYQMKIKISEFDIIELSACCKVDRNNGIYGFELTNKNEVWVNEILKITDGVDHTKVNRAKSQFRLIKNEQAPEEVKNQKDSDPPPLIILELENDDEAA